jgi:taurine dioxygenase
MMTITELPGVGAEVRGLDAATITDADFATLQKTFAHHGLLILRDQELTPEQHIAFAERWAPIDINRFFKAVDGYPQIAEVRKEKDQRDNIGGGWHTDHSYDAEPAMGSLLLARDLPPSGGDTLFASMYGAYDLMPESLRSRINGLQARHSSRHIFGDAGVYKDGDAAGRIGNQAAAVQDVIHPMVITHPLSGRKAVYVNPAFTIGIEGLDSNEAGALLMEVYAHCIDPAISYRLQWEEGTLAFWDNRATWHYALNDYHGHFRLMHRITVAGCALQ